MSGCAQKKALSPGVARVCGGTEESCAVLVEGEARSRGEETCVMERGEFLGRFKNKKSGVELQPEMNREPSGVF